MTAMITSNRIHDPINNNVIPQLINLGMDLPIWGKSRNFLSLLEYIKFSITTFPNTPIVSVETRSGI